MSVPSLPLSPPPPQAKGGMLADAIDQHAEKKIILINMVVILYFPLCVSVVAAGHLISLYLEGNQTIIQHLMSKGNQ